MQNTLYPQHSAANIDPASIPELLQRTRKSTSDFNPMLVELLDRLNLYDVHLDTIAPPDETSDEILLLDSKISIEPGMFILRTHEVLNDMRRALNFDLTGNFKNLPIYSTDPNFYKIPLILSLRILLQDHLEANQSSYNLMLAAQLMENSLLVQSLALTTRMILAQANQYSHGVRNSEVDAIRKEAFFKVAEKIREDLEKEELTKTYKEFLKETREPLTKKLEKLYKNNKISDDDVSENLDVTLPDRKILKRWLSDYFLIHSQNILSDEVENGPSVWVLPERTG